MLTLNHKLKQHSTTMFKYKNKSVTHSISIKKNNQAEQKNIRTSRSFFLSFRSLIWKCLRQVSNIRQITYNYGHMWSVTRMKKLQELEVVTCTFLMESNQQCIPKLPLYLKVNKNMIHQSLYHLY